MTRRSPVGSSQKWRRAQPITALRKTFDAFRFFFKKGSQHPVNKKGKYLLEGDGAPVAAINRKHFSLSLNVCKRRWFISVLGSRREEKQLQCPCQAFVTE